MNRFLCRLLGVIVLLGAADLWAQSDPPPVPAPMPLETRTVTEEVTRTLEDGTTVTEQVTREVPVETAPRVLGAPQQSIAPNASGSQNSGQFMNNNAFNGAGASGVPNSGEVRTNNDQPPPPKTRTFIDESGNRVTETTVFVPVRRLRPDGSIETEYVPELRSQSAPNSSGSNNTQGFTNTTQFPGGGNTSPALPSNPSMNGNSGSGIINSGSPPIAPPRTDAPPHSGSSPSLSGNLSSGTPPLAPPQSHAQGTPNNPPVAPPVNHSAHTTSPLSDPPGVPDHASKHPIVIINKAKYGESVFYVLIDGNVKYPMSMKPGEEQKLAHDRNWIIEYQSAPGEIKQYELKGKQLYIFHPDAAGDWKLYMDNLRE